MLQSIDFQQLAKLVLATGLTTKELGLRIGLSQPAISRLATGKTKGLSGTAAVRLIELAGGQIALPPCVEAMRTSAVGVAEEARDAA